MSPGAPEPEDGSDEAARAFEDLRAEVADLRRAIQALEPAIREGRAPDYSLSLGRIAKAQVEIGSILARLERHPALQMTPESVAARIERAAESATRPALRNAECAAAAISDASQDLAAMLGSARTRRAQRTRLMQAGAVGVLAGLILLPLLWWPLARVLPSGFSDRIAAAVLGQAPWEAGMGLMMRANAGWWDGLAEGWRRSEAAGPELRSCYEAARTSGREQRCTVTVKPGALR